MHRLLNPTRVRAARRAAATVLASAALVAGCGNEFTRDDVAASFATSAPDVPADAADCVVDDLIETFGIDGLAAELEAEQTSIVYAEADTRARLRCGLVGDVRAELVTELEGSGITSEASACVADALLSDLSDDDIEVLLSGASSEAFTQKYLDAAEDCGAT